jgi:hypothetical protein
MTQLAALYQDNREKLGYKFLAKDRGPNGPPGDLILCSVSTVIAIRPIASNEKGWFRRWDRAGVARPPRGGCAKRVRSPVSCR